MARLSLLTTLTLTLASAPASASDGDNEAACPMWLAPSYINPHNTNEFKYGLYAGRTYEKDSVLPLHDLAFPLIDFLNDFNRQDQLGEQTLGYIEGHLWQQEDIGSQWEGSLGSPALIGGYGILAKFHSNFFNTETFDPSVLLREQGEESPKAGEASLLRGAVTPYFNATLKATAKIPAGMEIFADYGQNWVDVEENSYQDKIHGYDYQLADKLVEKLVELYEKHPDMSLDMQESVMEFMLQKVLGAGTGPEAKVVSSLIPENPRKLQKVVDAGGTFMYRFRDMIRSDEWLQQNGFCLDTIRQGVSTIPNAGRGAFADRDIKNGTNIVVTPLLHICNKHLLQMHPIVDGQVVEEDEPTKAQILLNYAFGHDESDIVFFPTAPQATLINHGGAEANAYIAWADEEDEIYNPNTYFGMGMEDLSQTTASVFIMKIVADRDIAEGEEITIDYGPSWEQAWAEYEVHWKNTREGRPHPLKAADMRKLYKDKPLETQEYLEENPHPEGVFQACYMVIQEFEDGMPMTDFKHGTEINNFKEPTKYEEYDATVLYYVDVLEVIEAPGFLYNYTVRAALGPGPKEYADVHNVPHSACTFMDREYTSDLHLEGAFRHPIGLPDDMIPMLWRY